MQVVQIFLPLRDNGGRPFAGRCFDEIGRILTERFGGVTVYARSPAHGLWQEGGQKVADDIVVFEVMADTLDSPWWRDYRRRLENQFRQREIVIRAMAAVRL
jgi:hypothetical protein